MERWLSAMCDFQIQELKVTNYRRFKEKSYQLNPQMTIFAGKNGSGKTTMLEAVNVMLGAYLAAFKTYVPSRFVFNIKEKDVRLKPLVTENKTILTTGGIPQYPCKISCKAQWDNQQGSVDFQRVVLKADSRTKFGGANPMQPTVVAWENEIAKADHSDENLILPLVLYLSSSRLWSSEKKNSTKSGVYSRTDAYDRCLDKQHGLELAFRYIETLKTVAFEENEGKPYPAYEAILNAVNVAFQDELLPNEEIIFSTKYEGDMIALRTEDGTIVPFDMLSDGYRNVIKIILDIAARMCILNPYQKGDALKNTPGVVTIDELDLSLHPTWQKRIVGILKKLFPKIQFICATHSPFIIQSLEEGELITLDHPLESDYSGEGIEDIAEDVMGVEMPQYSEKKRKMYETAEQYYSAIKQGKTQEDIERLGEQLRRLEAEYSDNPAYLALIRQEYIEKKWKVKDASSK